MRIQSLSLLLLLLLLLLLACRSCAEYACVKRHD
jgi:hypothetical protein